jgi:uncharacterized C2H2 Zn-finger protein
MTKERKNLKVIQPLIDGGNMTRGVIESMDSGPDKEAPYQRLKEQLQAKKDQERAEKKKRVPKPVMLPETRQLVTGGWLAFLSCAPDRATDEMILVSASVLLAGCDPKGIYYAHLAGQVKHLRETIRNLNRAAFSPEARKDSRLFDWLNEAVACIGSSFSFTGSEALFFYPTMVKGALSDHEHIRALGASLVGMSFRKTKENPNGNGAFFIGRCPRCEKVFEKKQANAEYCGKSCANMVSRDRIEKK